MALTNKSRVILGPLTTVFTPPAPCTIAVGLCATCDVAWLGQTCGPTAVQDDTGCWPPTTEGAPEPTAPLYGWGFFSPGLECPAGYTSACTAISGQATSWRVQYQMEAEETFVGCCPAGFRCDNLNGQTCIRWATSTALPTVSCDPGTSNKFGFTTLPNPEVTSLSLFAPMIQLAFRSSDLQDASITSSSSPTSSATSAPTTSISGSQVIPSTSPLSTGAIAGIAVGGAALILTMIAALVFVWRRRRRGDLPGSGTHRPAYSVSEYSETKEFAHYYAGDTAELGQGHEKAELGQGHERAELPADGHGRIEMFVDHRIREGGFAGREGLPSGQYPHPYAPEAVELPTENYR